MSKKYITLSLAIAAAIVVNSCTEVYSSDAPAVLCDSRCQPDALANIATGYASIGQMEKAQQLLSQATQTAESLSEQTNFMPDLEEIAISYAELGLYDEALQAIETVDEAKDGAYSTTAQIMLYRVIRAAIQARDYERAIQLTQTLDPYSTVMAGSNRYSKATSFLEIAEAATQAPLSESEEILDQLLTDIRALPPLPANQQQFVASAKLAENYDEIDRSERAQQILDEAAQRLNEQAPNSFEFADIAQSYIQIGQLQKADQLLDRVYQQILQRGSYLPSAFPSEVSLKVVVGYVQAGQENKAMNLLTQMAAAVKEESVNPTDRHKGLDWLANTYIALEMYDQALQTIELKYQWYPRTEAQMAVQSQSGQEDPEVGLASQYAKLGEHEKAARVAKLGRAESDRTAALLAMAHSYAEVGEYNRALQAAELLENPTADYILVNLQVEIITAVARQAAAAESPDQAAQILEAALQQAELIDRPEQKIAALSALSIQYATVGQPDQAADLLEQSLSLIE